jgi:ubiquinone/menaquinone biosynthesis C-methylase UbiE
VSQTPLSEEHGRRARSFGSVAQQYQRGRPAYPPEAIEWLLGADPLEVVDLAAGTGKLTRVLIDAGHRVRAIEPLSEMRALLAQSAPEAELIEGTAEQIPFPAKGTDAVLVGAAFHWFDHERALAEIARVLRPHGVLGLLGNGFDNSVSWMESLRERLGSRAPSELPRRWPEPARLEQIFQSVERREFLHEQPIDLPGLRDLAVSRSGVALMARDERRRLLEDLGLLWDEHVGAQCGVLAWRTCALRARGLRA